MLESGISRHVFGDYTPSSRLVSALDSLPCDTATRLACLLWECESEDARRILRELKYSNALTGSTMSVLSSRDMKVPRNDVALRRFIVTLGDDAERAADVKEAVQGASALSRKAIEEMRKTGFCRSISDLAIDGKDLIDLGIVGKDIGKTLEALFDATIDDPRKNSMETLIKLAKEFNNK